MMIAHNELARLLDTLEMVGPATQVDLLMNAAMETSGYYVTPDPENSWDAKTYQIKAHGISGEATTERAAVADWIKAARRIAETWEDITIAGHIIRGDCGLVTNKRMLEACDVILGPTFHPTDPESQQLYTAATELKRILTKKESAAA
jgi:hypothetical protein